MKRLLVLTILVASVGCITAESIEVPDPTPPAVTLFLLGEEGIEAAVPSADYPDNATISPDKEYRLIAFAGDGNAGVRQVRISGEINVYCNSPGYGQSVWASYLKRNPEAVAPVTPDEVPTFRGAEIVLEGGNLKSFCSSGFKFGKATGHFMASADSYGDASAQTPPLLIQTP